MTAESAQKGVTFYIPLDVATTTAEGSCLLDRWWVVHPKKGVAWWACLRGYCKSDEPSPQCNSSEGTARYLAEKLHPGCVAQQIPVVFTAPAHREMRRLMREAA